MLTVIQTETEYEEALIRIEALMGAKAGSLELEELKNLALLVENYEDQHYPIGIPPDKQGNTLKIH